MNLKKLKVIQAWLKAARPMQSLFLISPLLAGSLAVAQQPASVFPDMEDSLAVATLLKSKQIPCLAIGYLQGGQPDKIRVFGELQPGQPATANAIFNVASVTKTITAMVTLTLVDSGSWELDAPVSRYFTDNDVQDDARSKRLTTRHILTHQTGFPNWRSELAGEKLAFQFKPGTKHQYSGEEFEYLRRTLANKFNRSLSELADSIIFKPLGMSSTGFTWKPADDRRFAYPFDAAGKQVDVVKNFQPNAADLLKTTAGDYCRFMAWILSGGRA